MSKISEHIRKAALGPEPIDGRALHSWVDFPAWHATRQFIRKGNPPAGGYLARLSPEDRRTFLLLVAEALS